MTERELARLLKEVKPYFEPREEYGWDAGCETSKYHFIAGVYSYKGELFVEGCDGNEGPFSGFPKNMQDEIIQGTIDWLRKQPQIPERRKRQWRLK